MDQMSDTVRAMEVQLKNMQESIKAFESTLEALNLSVR